MSYSDSNRDFRLCPAFRPLRTATCTIAPGLTYLRCLRDSFSACWSPNRDSNSDAVRHWNLNPACLPISPSGVAVEVGFEPTDAFTSTVFKTAALGRSATPPKSPRQESNLRHQRYKGCALPTELQGHLLFLIELCI